MDTSTNSDTNSNSNTNSKTSTILLDNVDLLHIPVDYIIFFASIILPFINETSIVLTKSGLPLFKHFYKTCIPDELIEMLPSSCKKNMNVVCSSSETFRRLFIDAIAYLGIILNIGRSTIKYGYVTGVVNGFVLIICSIVFPNLYLGQIIHNIKGILHIETPFMSIAIGLVCIILLMFITKYLQDLSTYLFKNYRIDEVNEPEVKNKSEQDILSFF